jgi:hypothetical protein
MLTLPVRRLQRFYQRQHSGVGDSETMITFSAQPKAKPTGEAEVHVAAGSSHCVLILCGVSGRRFGYPLFGPWLECWHAHTTKPCGKLGCNMTVMRALNQPSRAKLTALSMRCTGLLLAVWTCWQVAETGPFCFYIIVKPWTGNWPCSQPL